MADLGDLSDFLKEGNVPNLDWLDVNEQDYRELDTLPRQNLDVVPDLEAAWAHEGQPSSSYFVPNKADAPRTVGDMSEVHGPLRTTPYDLLRYARRLYTSTSNPKKIATALRQRFDRQSLLAAKTELAALEHERGLLGGYYIDASDFPGCHNAPKPMVDFVRKYALDARFVRAKSECSGCVHAKNDNCSVFHKQIVVEVPYTETLAEAIERAQNAKGKPVEAHDRGKAPRFRIQAALLASPTRSEPLHEVKPVPHSARALRPVKPPEPVQIKPNLTVERKLATEMVDVMFQKGRITVKQAQHVYRAVADAESADDLTRAKKLLGSYDAGSAHKPAAYSGPGEQPPLPEVSEQARAQYVKQVAQLMVERTAAEMEAISGHKAAPVVALLRREMLKGRSESELLQALRLAFDERDLKVTSARWLPLFRQAGLYGTIFSTQESFSNCHEGADFLAKHSSPVRAIVAGSKCSGCFYNKLSRCLLYGRKLVGSVDEIVNFETVEQVLDEHRLANRLSPVDVAQDWGSDPARALRRIHASVSKRPRVQATRTTVQTAFHGSSVQKVTTRTTKQNVVLATRRYMNEGLYGAQLLEALKRRFEARDIKAASAELRPILAEQGLQGVYYVDPTVYPDYGKGCDEAARLHRSRVVKYAKVGPACATCVLQRTPGRCSKLAKALVVEPPYEDKVAVQRAVLAEKSTDVPFEQLVNNGTSMVAEFEMQGQPLQVDVDEPPEVMSTTVEFDNGEIKL